MIHIIILSPDNPFKQLGGCGTVIKTLIDYCNEEFFFHILGQGYYNCKGKNYEYYEIESNFFLLHSFELTELVFNSIHHRLISNTTYIATICKILEKHPKAIIHNFDWCQGFAALETKRLFNNRLLFFGALPQSQQIDGMENVAPITNFSIKIELECLEKADIVMFASKYCSQICVFKHKTIINPHGLSNWKKKNDYQFPGNPEHKKLVFIGRFTEQKGLQYLFNIKLPDNVDLFYYGSENGSNIPIYNKMLSSVDNKRIFYMESIYGQEKIDMFHSADAIIMPSTYEPYGMVALETLRSKTLLISTLKAGIGEITNEDVSLKVELNEKDIQDKIYQFSIMSDEEYQKRVELGYQLSLSKSVENEIDCIEKVYRYLDELQ